MLQKANAARQRIFHIAPANKNLSIFNIHLDSISMTEICDAPNADKEVITHTNQIIVWGWSGSGYIFLIQILEWCL